MSDQTRETAAGSGGLPPGQRERPTMPRFADDPLRPPPEPAEIDLRVSVDGSEPVVLGACDLGEYPAVEQSSDFHCVTTWTVTNLRWRGYRFSEVIEALVGNAPPPYLTAVGADDVRAVFVTGDLMKPDVLLATHLNDQPLDIRHGAPLRLVTPGQYGYKNVKHLTALEFGQTEPASRYGKKEHLRARVDREERHRTWPNWALRPLYGVMVGPTAWVAERTLARAEAKWARSGGGDS